MKILFVCTGNICRSPMAEGIARAAIEDGYPDHSVSIEIISAGTSALGGHPPTAPAVEAMERQGIDISGYRAQSLSRGLVEDSDLVLVMEESQRAHALALSRGAAVPAFLLLKLAESTRIVLKAEEGGLGREDPMEMLESMVSVATVMERNEAWELSSHQYEVSDPIGMPLEWYIRAAEIMEAAIDEILGTLLPV